MLIRLLNYSFYFILILIFVLVAGPITKILILLAFLLSSFISFLSFIFKWLTLDGMKAATILGTISLGLGGLEFTLYLLVFFMSSNFIGAVLDEPSNPKELRLSERRTDEQVWANGFWFALLLTLWFIFEEPMFAVASIASIAVATSDTWATLIGGYSNKKMVWLITSFKKVPSGSDGGISAIGTLSGLLGAMLIGLLTLFFSHSFPIIVATSIIIGGFAGCLADSFFGSTYQFNKNPFILFKREYKIGNNIVNWMATATGAFISLLTYNILIYAMV